MIEAENAIVKYKVISILFEKRINISMILYKRIYDYFIVYLAISAVTYNFFTYYKWCMLYTEKERIPKNSFH